MNRLRRTTAEEVRSPNGLLRRKRGRSREQNQELAQADRADRDMRSPRQIEAEMGPRDETKSPPH
ncbi:hypothetical protein HispidOSU_011716 [Sigmodon hispidus]